MLEFFENYSFSQILVFTIMLSVAVKGVTDFVEWIKTKYEKKFNKDHLALKKEDNIEKYYEICQNQHKEVMGYNKRLEDKMDLIAKTMREKVERIENQLVQLTESDMHDIKGWIVEKHHALIKKGWIDDFTMDTLERRYSDYLAEDGNSYIAGLMTDLRSLPHFPPELEAEEEKKEE